MAPPEKLTPKVLAALGLLGCTQSNVCLSMQACLDYAPPEDTGDTGDTAEEDADGRTAVNAVIERGGLPADITDRLEEA
jgi:hypothetical protein